MVDELGRKIENLGIDNKEPKDVEAQFFLESEKAKLGTFKEITELTTKSLEDKEKDKKKKEDEEDVPDIKELKQIFLKAHPEREQKDRQVLVFSTYTVGPYAGKIFEFFCYKKDTFGTYIQESKYFLYDTATAVFYTIDGKNISSPLKLDTKDEEEIKESFFGIMFPQYGKKGTKDRRRRKKEFFGNEVIKEKIDPKTQTKIKEIVTTPIVYNAPGNSNCYEIMTANGRFLFHREPFHPEWTRIIKIKEYVQQDVIQTILGRGRVTKSSANLSRPKKTTEKWNEYKENFIPMVTMAGTAEIPKNVDAKNKNPISSKDTTETRTLYNVALGDNVENYIVDNTGAIRFPECKKAIQDIESNYPAIFVALTEHRKVLKKEKNEWMFVNSKDKKFTSSAEGILFLNEQISCFKLIKNMDPKIKYEIYDEMMYDEVRKKNEAVYTQYPELREKMKSLRGAWDVSASKKVKETKTEELNEVLLVYLGRLFDTTIASTEVDHLKEISFGTSIKEKNGILIEEIPNPAYTQWRSELTKTDKQNALEFTLRSFFEEQK